MLHLPILVPKVYLCGPQHVVAYLWVICLTVLLEFAAVCLP